MHKILSQAFGHEPESLWMSAIGTVAAFIIPAAFVLVAVAFGWGGVGQ